MSVRPWPWLMLGFAIMAAITVAGVRVWSMGALRDEAAIRADLQWRLSAAAKLAASSRAGAPTPDFTQTLPITIPVDGLVQTLQRSADAFAVTVVSVSSEPHAETAQTLPRLSVDIALRGTYPAIKSTLAEALSRYPNAVIQQLRVKRDSTTPGREDATIDIVMPLRPS